MMTLGFARGCASVVSTLCMQTARKARRFFFSWAFFSSLPKEEEFQCDAMMMMMVGFIAETLPGLVGYIALAIDMQR